MLHLVAFDWRLVTLFEGEAMSPASLYRLFDKFERHQAWRRKTLKERSRRNGRA